MRIVIVGYGEMFQALISGVLTTKHEVVGVFRHEKINPVTFNFIVLVLKYTMF